MKKKEKRARQIKALLIFGIVLTLFLILIVSTVGRKGFNTPHKFALEVVGTLQSAFTQVTSGLGTLWTDYVALWDVREENKKLSEEISKLKAINNHYQEAISTNVRLTKLLKVKESLPPPTLTAQIIGKDPSIWSRTVVVDRGSNEGVRKGMPVVTDEGVVGQVMDTSPHFAKVLLATDPNSAIDALDQSTRVQGIIKGDGHTFSMHYVLKNYIITEGDTIITSGVGGVFPKGLPIGKVSNITKSRRGMFQQITISPAVDFSTIEYLIIILTENPLTR